MTTDAAKEATNKPAGKTSQQRRLERQALEEALVKKRCPNCSTKGSWEVYAKRGRVRYIRCIGCRHVDKVPVYTKEN